MHPTPVLETFDRAPEESLLRQLTLKNLTAI